MCVTYGRSPEMTYSGGASGNIYVWQDVTLTRTVSAHRGPCFAMHSLDKVSVLKIVILINTLTSKIHVCDWILQNES